MKKIPRTGSRERVESHHWCWGPGRYAR